VGIYVDVPGIVNLTNTILVNQSNGIVAVGVGSNAWVNGVLWHDNDANYSEGIGSQIMVTNVYTGNPAFLPDGYHLSALSAAIDRGVPSDVATDIDGEARPSGAAPDLGADEYVVAPVLRMYFPLVNR
jgi:hypothetical protein